MLLDRPTYGCNRAGCENKGGGADSGWFILWRDETLPDVTIVCWTQDTDSLARDPRAKHYCQFAHASEDAEQFLQPKAAGA